MQHRLNRGYGPSFGNGGARLHIYRSNNVHYLLLRRINSQKGGCRVSKKIQLCIKETSQKNINRNSRVQVVQTRTFHPVALREHLAQRRQRDMFQTRVQLD